ncbi:MAG: DUF4013 domain-containing protein [Anaerolineales bacterium]|nr:DUF4013 domain-containing protein [Anaerolineales bacterium]
MFFGFNLNEIFMFPVKDDESRKHFYVGIAVSLLAFIVPIVPYIILFGYGAQIAKQIINGESPRMIAWTDWGKLFKDGLKVFGARLVIGLPILVFVLPIMIISFAFPFVMENASAREAESMALVFTVIMLGFTCFIFPISLVMAVIIPAPEMYVIDKDDFKAVFQFREWWKIFRANLGGFIAAFGIYYIVSFVMAFAMQILIATLILACLLIVLLPAMTIYITLIMYVLGAMAYKDGKAKLAQTSESSNASA